MTSIRLATPLALLVVWAAAQTTAAAQQAPGVVDTVHVAPGEGDSRRFEEAPCPFEASPQVLERVRCGWLVVPENRAAPQGRQLRLAGAILKSASAAPRPDPVVFLSGGPGGPSVQLVPGRLRDPERATGYSEPELCPAVTDAFFRIIFVGMGVDERRRVQEEDLARCAEAMRAEGVDRPVRGGAHMSPSPA